jgi:bifunctional DNA-binding transcriptional regulator/antitoxin component of YhaV-PrlF toxin-antitoxin module
MAKVTSKYQVTVPRKIAEAYHIRPGDDIDWAPAGEVIRVIPRGKQTAPESQESRLHLFDQATARHKRRRLASAGEEPSGRGLKREELNGRGRSRWHKSPGVRFDDRFPGKPKIAIEILRRGIIEDSVRLLRLAIVEFVAAVTRPIRGHYPQTGRRSARSGRVFEPVHGFFIRMKRFCARPFADPLRTG